jgi:MoxR-like ATPase
VAISDRRAVKVLKLVASSSVLSGRTSANVSDLWVLRYVWDKLEQIGPLSTLVSGILERVEADSPHPRSARPDRIDPESLARELSEAERELASGLKLIELARLRERVQAVADRAAWVKDSSDRGHLIAKAGSLLEKLG